MTKATFIDNIKIGDQIGRHERLNSMNKTIFEVTYCYDDSNEKIIRIVLDIREEYRYKETEFLKSDGKEFGRVFCKDVKRLTDGKSMQKFISKAILDQEIAKLDEFFKVDLVKMYIEFIDIQIKALQAEKELIEYKKFVLENK